MNSTIEQNYNFPMIFQLTLKLDKNRSSHTIFRKNLKLEYNKWISFLKQLYMYIGVDFLQKLFDINESRAEKYSVLPLEYFCIIWARSEIIWWTKKRVKSKHRAFVWKNILIVWKTFLFLRYLNQTHRLYFWDGLLHPDQIWSKSDYYII